MTSFWRQNDVKVKFIYIAFEKCVWRHFLPRIFKNLFFLKGTIIIPNLVYFGSTEAKLQREDGFCATPTPQVENVLNLPCEVGLNVTSFSFIFYT